MIFRYLYPKLELKVVQTGENLDHIKILNSEELSIEPDQVDEVPYHKSWDWLFNAIKHIRKGGATFTLYNYSIEVTHNDFNKIYVGGSIDTTYRAVVEYIKWEQRKEATHT